MALSSIFYLRAVRKDKMFLKTILISQEIHLNLTIVLDFGVFHGLKPTHLYWLKMKRFESNEITIRIERPDGANKEF